MKLNKFLLLLFFVNCLLAQKTTTAKIESVAVNGLHKIILPPVIRSFSTKELSDFRIFDESGNEVPYYILEPQNQTASSRFTEFKIISKIAIPKKETSIIFENPKDFINQITLSISNSDATKTYNISGSNDQKEWFGLINNAKLYQLENNVDVSVLKNISLPLTSYRYLKIDFDDKKTLPINVLKIGLFTNTINHPNITEIVPKNTRILQFPTEKKTLVYIRFDYPQIINQISFSVTNPNLFQRNAHIYVNKNIQIKRKTKLHKEILSSFELNSKHKNTFSIPQFLEKECYIEIENKDNQPLTFSKIKFFQNPIAVIADLKVNKNYTIETGNPKLRIPEYDLENFKNNSNNKLPEAKIYDIKHLNTKKERITYQSFWQQSWFMWLCISLGGIAIAYFTTSLVNDMKNNPSK